LHATPSKTRKLKEAHRTTPMKNAWEKKNFQTDGETEGKLRGVLLLKSVGSKPHNEGKREKDNRASANTPFEGKRGRDTSRRKWKKRVAHESQRIRRAEERGPGK